MVAGMKNNYGQLRTCAGNPNAYIYELALLRTSKLRKQDIEKLQSKIIKEDARAVRKEIESMVADDNATASKLYKHGKPTDDMYDDIYRYNEATVSRQKTES